LDNISVVLKALFYQDDTLALSGGLSVTAPTAQDTRLTVTDYLGNYIGNQFFEDTFVQRVRNFKVSNDTWGVSPFVAALWRPSDRFFLQGFAQIDVPVGDNKVTYTQTYNNLNPIIPFGIDPTDPRSNVAVPPYSVNSKVREQVLAHLDIGAGYWAYRDPNGGWLTGFAPTVELHYTTTLNNAKLSNLPNDPIPNFTPTGTINAFRQAIVEKTFDPNAPVVGNTRNRLDIVNLTAGGTFVLADQATLATAVALPLRGGDNRTFDWELQVQFNWYFGGPRGSGGIMPNMFR
jgi:hypothetical protein